MELAQKLEDLHRLSHRHWMKNASSLGMSYSEFEYLSAIKEQELTSEVGKNHGQHLHDIVTAMGVNKASASAMMDKLERRKLVRVKPCKRDARAKHFVLTKRGDELRIEGQAAYTQLSGMMAEILGAAVASNEPASKVKQVEETGVQDVLPTPVAKPKKPKAAKPKEPTSAAPAPQLSLFG